MLSRPITITRLPRLSRCANSARGPPTWMRNHSVLSCRSPSGPRRTWLTATLNTTERAPLVRRILRAVLTVYMRLYHRLELHGAERLPSRGPAIVLVNHASLLDVPALMVLDPYPNTVFIAKASLLRLPIIGWLLNQ